MTRQNDIVDEIQLPCSKILVRFGSRIYNVQKVMDSLLIKFQPGSPSHFYVIATLSDLATCNPTHIVPYLKAILGTMLANIKTTKKDNLRYKVTIQFIKYLLKKYYSAMRFHEKKFHIFLDMPMPMLSVGSQKPF